MVRLREIPRTATFAWSPGSGLPLIATGTRAGAVDADFSDDTSLELWNLNLGDPDHGVEVQPAASISTDSRFHDIAWGRITNDHRWGVIAGALENGALDLWDADALLKGSKDSFMSRTTKHSGAIKSLQFNPFKPELLATAGAKGELFISDLNNVANPFRLGNSAARADDFEAVDWNKKVPHILATGSSGGFVTVWDVRAKKENLTLHNMGRKAVSAVAWDPEQSTKLITAIPDDTSPLILVWDLRNSQAPERTLKAHEGGVLSLSWCQQDTNLLLSCGKDNRTICWNPRTGQPYGEFPVVTNWTFQTRWNPHNPSLLATASFDGKIAVQTIQNTNGKDSTAGSHRPKLDGEAFFDNAQTQPQEATFSLPVPPKWLERPVGVSFGFGGKVVSFGPEDTTAGSTSRKSKIRISQFEVDSSVGNATETFEKALQQGDLASICQSKISSAKSDEEKADWSVIETLIASDPKSKLLSYIGFSQAVDTAADGMGKLGFNDEDQKFDGSPETDKQVNGAAKSNRLSSFFDNKDDGDSFLSDLAATKGAKTNNPFEIYTGSETAPDKQITKALLVGRFEEALDICLKEQRMSDAFMIAICGGQSCIEKAKAAYFTKKAHGPNYLRLLASVSGKNLWDVVHNANLKDWKEAMAMFCTFAEPKEFPDLCEALGDRLEEELKGKTSQANLRKDASLCYMAGSKLENVVKIWVEELKESEESFQDTTGDSAFSIHARSLQNLIEKVTVFRAVTKFQDTERTQSSGWKLAPLYDKYAEYADVVAAHGQLEVAEKYLDLLPPNYPAAEVARNRVKQASRKATPAATARQTATATRTGARTQPAMPGYPSMQAPQTSATPANPYSISGGAAQPPNPYGAPASNAYAPQGYQAQQSQGYNQGQAPQMYGGFQQQQQPPQKVGVPPPPRNTTASPAMPPASKRTDIPNWNDTPLVTKPPTSRRGTPGLGPAPITSPFPNQNNQPLASPPPTGAPFSMQQRATPPVAPPPKGSAPPRVSSPLVSGFQQNTFQQPERPPSAALNAYAPAPSSNQLGNVAPSIPRGASPYNAPPSAPPPSNRYAPAAAPQDSASSMQQPGSIAPPPQGGARPGPPPNPYAPQQSQFGSHTGQSSYPGTAPPPNFSQGTPSGLPQRAPPPLSRPGTAQSGSTPTAAAAVAPPAPPKYPAGDRSHLSPEGQSIYEILNGDMQRVKSRAPASFKAQVNDAEKRLNILFDHLNNDDLLKPDTVTSVVELAQALQRRDYAEAQAIQQEIHTKKTDECGSWMVGVNRLIRMSKATP